jgi:nucleoid-associated protein YgaU
MTINSLSRYTTDVAADGTIIAVRKQYSEIAVQTYIVKPGDTFENLAAKIYGDSSQHWRLLDLNPQIDFSFDLKANDRIRIPL